MGGDPVLSGFFLFETRCCRDKSLSRTINLNWTFTDTNPGIKKNYDFIKTVVTKKNKKIKIKKAKNKGDTKTNRLLPEDVKCQKNVL